jgi:hypothetical protein
MSGEQPGLLAARITLAERQTFAARIEEGIAHWIHANAAAESLPRPSVRAPVRG